MDADETRLLIGTARRILAGGDPMTLVTELADAGIATVVAADPALAGELLAAQGELLGRSTLLDLVLGGGVHDPGTRFVLPLPGSRRPPGSASGEKVDVEGVVLVPEGAAELLVHTGNGAVSVSAAALRLDVPAGFDPALGASLVRGSVAARDARPAADARDWDAVVEAAAVAVSHELVGVGQRALHAATAHVTVREQFGRPIGTLQTVRHRLTAAHVELEAARALLGAVGDGPGEIAAMSAKVAAGRAALGAVAAAQQLCGAMGFTAEHGLHAAVRRAYVLDSLFGCADDLEIEIGALLAARATLPAPVPLPTDPTGQPCATS